eukprot:gene18421-24125_t
MIYNFYIYNGKGKCLYYKQWNRPLNTLADDPDEDKKLMYGMLFSLKDLASKLAPTNAIGSDNIHVMKTNSYTLHYYQSLSNMAFVLNTDPSIPDMYQNLQFIYSNIYTECIVRNPLYSYSPDQPFDCPLFNVKLEEYLSTLPCWKSDSLS